MPNPERPSRRKAILTLLGSLLVILLVTGLVAYPQLKKTWSKPLGPSLDLPTHTPRLPTLPSSAIAMNGNPNSFATVPVSPLLNTTTVPGTFSPPAISQSTPTQAPLCGGPPVMTVLGIGADSGIDYLYGLGDVIRIARIDFVTPKVTMLSMPRDLWVELPPGISSSNGITTTTITHSKLNQTYFYGNPGMGYYDGPGAGPGLMARALDLNFGIRVDNYGAVNMQTFVKIVDAVGGIDLYLPTDVDGRPVDAKTEDMGYFTAGQHHFNGSEALRFSRIRKRYNDFTRMDHQNMVLCALQKKVLSPSVLPKIPQIIIAFQGSVLTDLSPEQISQLACLLPNIKRENLLFTSLPQEILQQSRVFSPIQKNETFVLQADFDVIRSYVDQFMAGTWPSEPKEPTCQ